MDLKTSFTKSNRLRWIFLVLIRPISKMPFPTAVKNPNPLSGDLLAMNRDHIRRGGLHSQ